MAPNRLLLLPVALLIALGLGVLTTFLASQLRAVFFDSRSLNQALGLPLLGTVNRVMSDQEIVNEKSELRKFGFATTALFLVFVTGMLVLSFVTDGAK